MTKGIWDKGGCGTEYYFWDGERLRVANTESDDATITPPEECLGCPKIIVRGKLARMLRIADCNGNSGMTCRIQFKRGSTLPSRIVVQQLDGHDRLIDKKFLPYPDLKPEEMGWASFPIGSARAVVLAGEWNGPWRSAY